MGALTEAAQQYLRLRRALGYELEEPGKLVLSFADHLDGLGITHVTVDAAAKWATAPRGAAPYWHWLRMSAVRGFAVHLHALDPRHQVPPSDMLPRQYTCPAPYLFSGDEIAALIRAAGRMRHGPAVTATYQTLTGLLAVTGPARGSMPPGPGRLQPARPDPDDRPQQVRQVPPADPGPDHGDGAGGIRAPP